MGLLFRDVHVPWPVYWAAPAVTVAAGACVAVLGLPLVGGVAMAAGGVMLFKRLTRS